MSFQPFPCFQFMIYWFVLLKMPHFFPLFFSGHCATPCLSSDPFAQILPWMNHSCLISALGPVPVSGTFFANVKWFLVCIYLLFSALCVFQRNEEQELRSEWFVQGLHHRIYAAPHLPTCHKKSTRKRRRDWESHWIAVENPLWFVHASPGKDKALLKWNNLLLREAQRTERMASSAFKGSWGFTQSRNI